MRVLSILHLSDANYSHFMIEDLESETHLQYLEYQWRSISTWNLYSSWCQSQLMMKLQFNKKTPNWVQPSRRKYTYQTAFNQFKRDTLIVKRKSCTAVVTMPTSDAWCRCCHWCTEPCPCPSRHPHPYWWDELFVSAASVWWCFYFFIFLNLCLSIYLINEKCTEFFFFM